MKLKIIEDLERNSQPQIISNPKGRHKMIAAVTTHKINLRYSMMKNAAVFFETDILQQVLTTSFLNVQHYKKCLQMTCHSRRSF